MNFESWSSSKFNDFGYEHSNELASYIINLSDISEVQEYLNAILNTDDAKHREFIDQFLSKYKEMKNALKPGYYRKLNIDDKSEDLNKKNDAEYTTASPFCGIKNQVQSPSTKKSKFVSLYSEEARRKDIILLPGRHKCDCQGSKHKLINNCLNCGRIVCEQEGSGPCAFCNVLVVSKEEKEIISRGSKKSGALHNKLLNAKKVVDIQSEKNSVPQSLLKAVDHKNKLLEYDRTSEKRTKVFDDESDYFQSSSRWINPSDREKLMKYEEEMKTKKYDRSIRTYTVDLLGRKVYTDIPPNFDNPNDHILREILQDNDPVHLVDNKSFEGLNISHPLYVEDEHKKLCESKEHIKNFSSNFSRIQDKELQEMTDEGMCLSMHQPWASLLTAGIKIHEGRDWYHSHRGRLWIASAAKSPTSTDISNIEQMYRSLFGKDNLKFPKNYPTSCLLGCVDVIDIIPQEEYRLRYPNGESKCAYVFVCDNPLEMKVKFPVRGQHKIYKLDKKIHQAALKSLELR